MSNQKLFHYVLNSFRFKNWDLGMLEKRKAYASMLKKQMFIAYLEEAVKIWCKRRAVKKACLVAEAKIRKETLKKAQEGREEVGS